MNSRNSKKSYLTESEKSWLIKIVIFIIVLAILAIPIFLISKSPLWKALAGLIGTIPAATKVIQHELGLCEEEGIFKCPLGIAAIIGFGTFALFSFASLFVKYKQTTTTRMIELTSAASGKSQSEILDDIIKEVMDEASNNSSFENASPEEQVRRIKKGIKTAAENKLKETIQKKQTSTKEKKQEFERAEQDAKNGAEDDGDDDETDETDDPTDDPTDDLIDPIVIDPIVLE